MSDDYGTQGLNGIEIVDDLLAQLRKRLLGDCNLRLTDSYNRGYSAKINYSVQCYGLDKVEIAGEFESGAKQDEPADNEGDGELEIEQEEDVTEVRDRTAKAIKAAKDGDDEEEEEEGDDTVATLERTTEGSPVRAKRKYTKKVSQLTSPISGGAEEFKE